LLQARNNVHLAKSAVHSSTPTPILSLEKLGVNIYIIVGRSPASITRTKNKGHAIPVIMPIDMRALHDVKIHDF
jgi:hypothetical protein